MKKKDNKDTKETSTGIGPQIFLGILLLAFFWFDPLGIWRGDLNSSRSAAENQEITKEEQQQPQDREIPESYRKLTDEETIETSAADLEILDAYFDYTKEGKMRYLVQVQNPNDDLALAFYNLNVCVKDLSGSTTLFEQTKQLDMIYPQETQWIAGQFFDVPQDADVLFTPEFKVDDLRKTEIQNPHFFNITGLNPEVKGDYVDISGSIMTIMQAYTGSDFKPVSRVSATIIFSDEQNKIVGFDSTTIDVGKEGETVPFNFVVKNEPEADRVNIHVYPFS